MIIFILINIFDSQYYNIISNKCSLRILTSSKCLIAQYMGRVYSPNGLIELPQVWGYVFSPMESSLKGKRKGRKALVIYPSDVARLNIYLKINSFYVGEQF